MIRDEECSESQIDHITIELFSREIMGCCCSAGDVIEKITAVTILGLPNAGKTSIIESLAGEYDPGDPPVQTSGIVQRGVEINGKEYMFYDVCGYSSHSDDWSRCIRKSEAVIIVFDPIGIKEAHIHAEGMITTVKEIIIEMNVPTMFVINKIKDEDQGIELREIVKIWGDGIPQLQIVEISSLDQMSLIKEFEWIESYVVE